jgi:hypothetical protein
MKWFGETWKAPICEDVEHVETPAGQPCFYCCEPFVFGSCGVMISHVDRTVIERPWHFDCFTRFLGVQDHAKSAD